MAEPMGREGRSSSSQTASERNAQGAFGLDPAQMAGNLEPFFVASSRFIENWRRASEELLEFGKTRLGRNIEASRKVARSGSLEEAIELQSEFARSMMQDYIAETGKLAEISSRAISDSFDIWRSERMQAGRAAREFTTRAQEVAESAAGRKVAAE
jgi:phasin family protein